MRADQRSMIALASERTKIRQAIYQWIRDDAPTGVKMMMDGRLTELLINRIAEAMAESGRLNT